MATTYDKASLVMIPSGVKESKLYSVKPTDGSGDFTFSRGTDTATRVNASGLIEKERGNLLLQSNTFDTTWTNFQSAETGGQPDKDGGSTAWKLTRLVNGANSVIYQTGLSYSLATFSVYAKAAEENWIYIEGVGSTFPAQFFDLQNGVKGTASGVGFIDSSITSVGGGWYRISITFNISGGNRVSIYQATADNTLTGSIGDGIYIQDAMLNQGLVAQPYIETTTAAVYEGITDNLPRLDYSGGASCPSLLLEPSRTNEIAHSEYFGAWTASSSTIVSNATTSPEGVSNAALIYPANATASLTGAYLLTSKDTTATLSCFVKSAGKRYAFIGSDNSISYACAFDLTTGEVVSEATDYTATIEPYEDGWYRITASYINSRALNYPFIGVGDAADGSVSISGTDGLYVYGFQYEHSASYVSSYIPTYGTSASRAAESCYKTSISDLIGQTEGTIFGEVQKLSGNQFASWRFSISDNTNDNWIFLSLEDDFDLRVYIRKNGSTNNDSQINNKFVDDGVYKIAIAYANNDVAVYVNGSLAYSSSTASIPNTTQFLVSGSGSQTGSSQNKKGKINQALLFKTRLTNAELAALTTL